MTTTTGLILRRNRVPPGGYWRWRDPDDGWEYAHPYYDVVRARAHAHRVTSGLRIPPDWEALFDRVLCEQVPAGCLSVPVASDDAPPSLRQKIANLARSMVEWAREGAPVVSSEVYEERAAVCMGDAERGVERCPRYHPGGRFGWASCTKCGCSKLKLYLATSRCPEGKWEATVGEGV